MKRLIYLVVVVLSLILGGCKDYLNTPPTTSAEQGDFITSLSSCEQLLNGSYRTMLNGFPWGLNVIYGDLLADNVKPSGGSNVLTAQYSWNQVAGQSTEPNNLNTYWNGYYSTVRSLAMILENIDKFRNENPQKADDIKGQALALRAWVHFDLANRFAQPYQFSPGAAHPGIPYIKNLDYNIKIERGTVNEDYVLIIKDLQDALPLTMEKTNKTYLGKAAIKALLSRVYLYKGDYLKAKDYAVNVIGTVPLMTDNYPDRLFTANETEALFYFAPPITPAFNNFTGTYYRGVLSFFLPTQDIISLIREDGSDKRNSWLSIESGVWKVSKFPKGAVAGIPDPAGAHYQTLIRSSEMYLNAAEAYAELGNADSAVFYLDKIRLRANPTAVPTTASGTMLVNTVLKERRKELAFEGFRFFDLRRKGKDIVREDASTIDAKVLPYRSPKAVAPIPRLEVLQNGLMQNESY